MFHRTERRENPNTRVHVRRHKASLSEGSAEPLIPSKRCVGEAAGCFSQSQHIFGSQFQPAFEIRRWVNVQRIAPFVGSPLRKAVFRSPLSNRCPSFTIHCKIADFCKTSESEMMWEVWSNEDPENQVRTIELSELLCSNILPC